MLSGIPWSIDMTHTAMKPTSLIGDWQLSYNTDTHCKEEENESALQEMKPLFRAIPFAPRDGLGRQGEGYLYPSLAGLGTRFESYRKQTGLVISLKRCIREVLNLGKQTVKVHFHRLVD